MAMETILVVDDDVEMLGFFQLYLGKMLGYHILEAHNGEIGLQIAQNQAPDLILLDMYMPQMTGIEMLKALRIACCQSPVIFMTAAGSEMVAIEVFRLGVRDYLAKPFTPQEMKGAVQKVLQETRLARERESLTRQLAALDAVRTMTVTLAHYVNNNLQVAYSGLDLLEETLKEILTATQAPRTEQMIKTIGQSLMEITAVLQVLKKITDIQITTYDGKTQMIDIRTALQEQIESLRKQ